TTRLIRMATHQVAVVATSSIPAMAELRASGDTERFWRATRAVGLMLVIFSGAAAVGLVAVTPAFVRLWVGPQQYGGPGLLVAAALSMVGRHWMVSLTAPALVLGYERRLAVVAVLDGLVSTAAAVAWTAAVGLAGPPLGQLTGLLLVTVPALVPAIAAARGTTWAGVFGWSAGWF